MALFFFKVYHVVLISFVGCLLLHLFIYIFLQRKSQAPSQRSFLVDGGSKRSQDETFSPQVYIPFSILFYVLTDFIVNRSHSFISLSFLIYDSGVWHLNKLSNEKLLSLIEVQCIVGSDLYIPSYFNYVTNILFGMCKLFHLFSDTSDWPHCSQKEHQYNQWRIQRGCSSFLWMINAFEWGHIVGTPFLSWVGNPSFKMAGTAPYNLFCLNSDFKRKVIY